MFSPSEREAREMSERIARDLGDGWRPDVWGCVGGRQFPGAQLGPVRVVQTSDSPVCYRAQVDIIRQGPSARDVVLALRQGVRMVGDGLARVPIEGATSTRGGWLGLREDLMLDREQWAGVREAVDRFDDGERDPTGSYGDRIDGGRVLVTDRTVRVVMDDGRMREASR